MDYTHILSMLRGQHRLGQTDPTGRKPQDDKDLKLLAKMLPGINDLTLAYATALTELDTANNQAAQGLGKSIAVMQSMNTEIANLTKNITFLEEHNKQLNGIFKVGSGKAQEYAETIRDIGIQVGFSDATINKYIGGVNELTNGFLMSTKITKQSNINYRNQMIAFQTYAVETLGLSQEQALGFQKYAGTMGVSAANATEQIKLLSDQVATEMGIDALTAQHDILAGIGEMSDDVRMNYSKIPGSLEVAVLKAKALGVTMEQLDSMGESLMNIEQSVGQEMEYQLLTGKRLLVQGDKSFTNEFRMAKLTGDGPKQAQLLADVLEDQGDTLRTNYMARKKFAEMAGISDKELSAVLTKTQIAKELGVESLGKLDGADFANKVADLKKEYTAMGDDGKEQLTKLAKLTESQDIRTSHEKVTEDNLIDIAKSIRKIGGIKADRDKDPTTTKGINVGKLRKDIPTKMSASYSGYKEKLSDKTISQGLGAATLKREAMDPITAPIKVLAEALPGFSGVINNLTGTLTSAAGIDLKSGTTPVHTKDVLITPNKGPILRPAKNDVIAAFRPNDVIHNTLSGMSKPAGGDGGMASLLAGLEKIIKTASPAPAPAQSFDIKLFASAIATALQSVKIEAKIRTDDAYASTSMNNGKNIT